MRTREPERLTCVECGREQADREGGWRAYLTDDEPAEAVVFCPDCAQSEFDLNLLDEGA
jgi:hypothetical protein